MKPGNRILTRKLLVLMSSLILGTMLLSACFIDRPGTLVEWTKNALPQNVCPGDMVTLTWDTRRSECLGDGCPESWHIQIDNDTGLLVPPFESSLQYGSTSAGPVSSDTTFHFSVFEGRVELTDTDPDRAVRVVLPERETIVPERFPGTCAGRPGWGSIDLREGVFRASMVRIVRACNINPFSITLLIEFDLGIRRSFLLPGDCTHDFDATMGEIALHAWVAPFSVPDPTFGADCSPTRQILPPPIDVIFVLTCGGSASEPITTGGVTPDPDSDTVELIPPTATLQPPTATVTPTAPNLPTVLTETLCWKGPGPLYEVVSSVKAGTQVTLLGRGIEGDWWIIDNPRYPGVACWLPVNDLDVDPELDLSDLLLLEAPPLPAPTATPIAGCLYQGPNDTQPICYPIEQCPVPFEQALEACTP